MTERSLIKKKRKTGDAEESIKARRKNKKENSITLQNEKRLPDDECRGDLNA